MSNEEGNDFKIMATKQGFEGFDFEKEGRWNGPFWFVQCADTQFGMMDSYFNKNRENPSSEAEIDLCSRMIEKINAVTPKPRFIVVCGDLVDASPIRLRQKQVQEFKKVFSQLDPQIKLVCVCGNHDVTDKPSPKDIQDYKSDFGDDYFSFWVGGVKFVTINSQYYVNDSSCKELRKAQDEWLANELREDEKKPFKHLIGLQHIPPFLKSPNENRVAVFDHKELSFNFPDMHERVRFLNQLKKANMSKLFCGHYHRNDGGWDDNLEVIVTTAVGCQLGEDCSGFRVVEVLEKDIKHKFYKLDDTLFHVSFHTD